MSKIIKKVQKLFGMNDFSICEKKSPVFWVIRESEERSDCTLVDFYSQSKAVIKSECLPFPTQQLSEGDVKLLNSKKKEMIYKIC